MRTTKVRQAMQAALGTVSVLALMGVFAVQPAFGQTLQEALVQAYTANPALESERAQLRATDELVPQAKSGYRPLVEANGETGSTHLEVDDVETNFSPSSVDLVVAQPLYRGGRTVASVKRSKNLVQAQRAALLSAEQDILLAAATAYLDVVQDQAVVSLNTNNEQVLSRQLEAAQDRFNVGEITRTDVSQAESRRARSIAERISAEGNLDITRATYARVIGTMPGELKYPEINFPLPESLEKTIELAESNNPVVLTAFYSEQAAENAVDQVTGELLPEVNLQGRLGRSWESSSTIDRSDSATIVARLRMPLYEGGSVTSRVREAKQTANQRRIEMESARRQAREQAVQAWLALTAIRAEIQSREAQVKSSGIALEGVQQEAVVGSRTTLDVLDAEQELLDARVNLVRSLRNEAVAIFQVLSAIGELTARNLKLPVEYYDPTVHYDEVENLWWGLDVPGYQAVNTGR